MLVRGPVACYCLAGQIRVHTAPKVASDAVVKALHGLHGWSRERVDDAGPEYRFGVVRHPLDRLVSGWAYFCLGDRMKNQPALREIGYFDRMPFEEFLRIATASHWMNQHTRKQVDFIGSQPFDRLVRIENLTDAWEDLRKIFPNIRRIVRRNTSEHGHWKTYFSADMAEFAERVYSEDLALYHRAET